MVGSREGKALIGAASPSLRRSVSLYFTKDDWEINVDSGMIQFHDSLRYEILLDPFQLGLLSSIFCHHHLLVELVGQITVLIVVQGTSPRKDERGCVFGATEPG